MNIIHVKNAVFITSMIMVYHDPMNYEKQVNNHISFLKFLDFPDKVQYKVTIIGHL
ncbi:MAG: hypothetical protein LBT10_08700 [Methanobrevibacter sp.]|jgi:hypothetical protein|nr:hypothetical protein [Methanobrevibacter sp.]